MPTTPHSPKSEKIKSPRDGSPKGREGNNHKGGYAEWKTTSPKNNDPHEQIVNGLTYYWCPNHAKDGLWAAHKPSDCSMKGKRSSGDNGNKKPTDSSKTTYDLSSIKPSARLTTAFSVLKKVQWADSDSSDDSDF